MDMLFYRSFYILIVDEFIIVKNSKFKKIK